MNRWIGAPAYVQIAGDYRVRILDGRLQPGAKLPSESELMRQYGVSRIVAKMAIGVLRGEGLVVSHQGKGSFVKRIRRIVRDSNDRYSRRASAEPSPFRSDAAHSGQRGHWEHSSDEVPASADIAQRLQIDLGAAVMRTSYRYFVDAEPIQLSISSEPLALTRGTAVMFPEDGPLVGVVDRLDSLGVAVDSVVEKVTARAAVPDEARRLRLPATGAYLMVIQRTHYAGDRPVETCDIVFPGDRYELTYRIPLD